MLDDRAEAMGTAVKSAVRVLDVFSLLAEWHVERTHTEIADALRIPKSSLTQLLKTLVQRRYLSYSSQTKTYSLGPAITDLARRSMARMDLVSFAPTVLAELTAATNETSALNLLRGDVSEVVCAEMSKRRLLYSMVVGDSAPLYATSGGKAILAHLPADMRRDYLARVRLEPITANTITSVPELVKQLDEAAKTGVAYVFEEYTEGIVGIAKPVLSSSGFPLAAVNFAMPRMRYSEEVRVQCVAALTRAANTLSKHLIGTPD